MPKKKQPESKKHDDPNVMGLRAEVLEQPICQTLEQNYTLLDNMEQLKAFNLPILVGASRKSMIFKLLGSSPAEALNGTTVINTMSLLKGASILRVHDVKECVETVKIVKATVGE